MNALLEKLPTQRATNHHDLFFKSFYSKPLFARELFKLIFDKEELSAYDWKNLKPEKDSLKEKRADLIFSVPLKLKPKHQVKIFILLEHKSHYTSQIYSQLLYYQTFLFESLSTKEKASPIIPVVFYHGKSSWRWVKTFQEGVYKGFLEKLPIQSRRNMIDYEIKLLDIHDRSLEEVFKDTSFKSRGSLNLLKEIWGLKLNRFQLREILALFADFSLGQNRVLIASVYRYLQAVLREGKKLKRLWESVEKELIEEGIFKKGGYMNILDHFKEEEHNKGLRIGLHKGLLKGRKEGLEKGLHKGLEKGRKEGLKEVALNMLNQKLDIALISKATGFSAKKLKKLKNGSLN